MPYQDVLKYFNNDPNLYAKEIQRKLGTGEQFSNSAAALSFMSANPNLFQPQQQIQPMQQQPDISSYIRELQQAQERTALANLDKSRQQALSNLGAEKSTIQPKFYEAKRQTIGQSGQGARSFQDYLAQRGLQSSGMAGQGELMRMGQLQGNIGALNQQETQAYSDIARRTTDVENAYLSDAESTRAGIQAQAMQNLINQMNADRQFSLQEAGVTGQYQGQQTLQAQQINQALQRGEIDLKTAQFNLAQLQDPKSPYNVKLNLEAEIAKIELANLPEKMRLEMTALRNQVANVGKAPYRSEQQVAMDNINLEMAQIKLRSLQKGERVNTTEHHSFIDKEVGFLMNSGANQIQILQMLESQERMGVDPYVIAQIRRKYGLLSASEM